MAPKPPIARRAPAQPWRSSIARVGRGPDMAPGTLGPGPSIRNSPRQRLHYLEDN